MIVKPFLDAIVVEDSQGDKCFPDSTWTDESDQGKVFGKANDPPDQLVASETGPSGVREAILQEGCYADVRLRTQWYSRPLTWLESLGWSTSFYRRDGWPHLPSDIGVQYLPDPSKWYDGYPRPSYVEDMKDTFEA